MLQLTDRPRSRPRTALQAHYLASGPTAASTTCASCTHFTAACADDQLVAGSTPFPGVRRASDAVNRPGKSRSAHYRRTSPGRQHRLRQGRGAGDQRRGGRPLPLYCASLRTAEPRLRRRLGGADAMVSHRAGRRGVKPAAASAGGDDDSWNVPAALDILILQGLRLTSPRDQWCANDDGLSPLDVASQVAVPEFDGRIITVPFSFAS